MQQARWQETMANERRRRPRRQSRSTTNALAARGREINIGFDDNADTTLIQTPARGL